VDGQREEDRAIARVSVLARTGSSFTASDKVSGPWFVANVKHSAV